jgi:IS5 family transposase
MKTPLQSVSNASYKPTGNSGWFDAEHTAEKLSKLGNPLEKLGRVVHFEMFRPLLEEKLLNHDKKSNAGCKPYDVVLMFKILLLKRFYHLGDDQAEYQINDRLSFKEFLGLSSGDRVPDARTIWLFQENVVEKHLEEELFGLFNQHLDGLGLFVNEGKIVDASFVEVPRQRNTREENEKIKAGEGADLWKDKPRKQRLKDVDARWTKKNGQTFYGYKDHAKIDSKSKLIRSYEVTHAAVHDSGGLEPLLEDSDKGQPLYADSAYVGAPIAEMLETKAIPGRIIERAFRGKPLTDAQKASNRVLSQTRCRCEHVFGFISNSMNGFYTRVIGLRRTHCLVGLVNLVYNLFRYEQIVRLKLLVLKPLPGGAVS